MNESAKIEITAALVGKRFDTLKDMEKAVQMEEESFKILLNTYLNNGIITMIHVNAQGWELFFSEHGPWITSDELAEATGKKKNAILRLPRMMPSWMVKKENGRYQFRNPAVEFVKNYPSPRRGGQNRIPPVLKLSPDARELWDKIPSKDQNKILKNVWCGSCRKYVKIVNTSGSKMRDGGLMLKGSCTLCKGRVARYIEPLKDRTR